MVIQLLLLQDILVAQPSQVWAQASAKTSISSFLQELELEAGGGCFGGGGGGGGGVGVERASRRCRVMRLPRLA